MVVDDSCLGGVSDVSGAGANEVLSVLSMSVLGTATAMASSWEGVGVGVEYAIKARLSLFALGRGRGRGWGLGLSRGLNSGLRVSRVNVGGACWALAAVILYC